MQACWLGAGAPCYYISSCKTAQRPKGGENAAPVRVRSHQRLNSRFLEGIHLSGLQLRRLKGVFLCYFCFSVLTVQKVWASAGTQTALKPHQHLVACAVASRPNGRKRGRMLSFRPPHQQACPSSLAASQTLAGHATMQDNASAWPTARPPAHGTTACQPGMLLCVQPGATTATHAFTCLW